MIVDNVQCGTGLGGEIAAWIDDYNRESPNSAPGYETQAGVRRRTG